MAKIDDTINDIFDHSILIVDRETKDKEKSIIIAGNICDFLRQHLGGQMLYFPKTNHLQQQRNDKILREFNGNNIECLARKHQLSAQWIYHILRTHRKQSTH